MDVEKINNKQVEKQRSRSNVDYQDKLNSFKEQYDEQITDAFHRLHSMVLLELPNLINCPGLPEKKAQIYFQYDILKWLHTKKGFKKKTILYPGYVCSLCHLKLSPKQVKDNCSVKVEKNENGLLKKEGESIRKKYLCPKCKKTILEENPDKTTRIKIIFDTDEDLEELRQYTDYINQFVE